MSGTTFVVYGIEGDEDREACLEKLRALPTIVHVDVQYPQGEDIERHKQLPEWVHQGLGLEHRFFVMGTGALDREAFLGAINEVDAGRGKLKMPMPPML
jgi:uncharacterized protein with ACT and thioredoxin-like domain